MLTRLLSRFSRKSNTKYMDEVVEKLKNKGDRQVPLQDLEQVMLAILSDSANILAHVLFQKPEAENFIIIPVKNENDPERNFNIILHKWGKDLPSEMFMLKYGGNLEKFLENREKETAFYKFNENNLKL